MNIGELRSQHKGMCAFAHCSAPIFFVPTEASKGQETIPLDWDPNPTGNVLLVDNLLGETHARLLGPKAERPENTVLWISHFATCPGRERFRKPKA